MSHMWQRKSPADRLSKRKSAGYWGQASHLKVGSLLLRRRPKRKRNQSGLWKERTVPDMLITLTLAELYVSVPTSFIKLQQKRYWNLNIYVKTLFYFIFNWSVLPLISSTKSGPRPELDTSLMQKPRAVGSRDHWIFFLQRFATFLQPHPTFLQIPCKFSLNPKP